MITDTMREATRLTRQGRLGEATALLRAALSGAPRPAASGAAASRPPKIIDMRPPARGETAWTASTPAPPPTPAGDTAREQPYEGRAAAKPDGLGAGLLGRLSRTRKMGSEPVPAGAAFGEHVFAAASGRRSYKLYVPASYAGKAVPLVVMLHGCNQTPDDFAAGTRMNALAEEFGLLVAYPAQSQSANPSRCWNWFNGADQQRDGGEPALVAGIARQVMHDFAVDSRRIYAAGLSAGGAAAAVLGVVYPDLFAAVGVHSGLACGAARDVRSALAVMRTGGAPGTGSAAKPASGRAVRAIVFHGDRDGTVNPLNGDQVFEQFGGMPGSAGDEVVQGSSPGGRSFTRVSHAGADGRPVAEHWTVHGAGHAWSGGSSAGSYTDPRGPDASREMLRFFLAS